MTVTDTLLRCMVEMGLSESVAMFHVEKIAAGVARDLELERRERVAHDLLPEGPDAVMERLGVCRRSAYYMAGRWRRKCKARRNACTPAG